MILYQDIKQCYYVGQNSSANTLLHSDLQMYGCILLLTSFLFSFIRRPNLVQIYFLIMLIFISRWRPS